MPLKNNKEEPPGIGISWLWKLPDTHPFYPAAQWHDEQYDKRKRGEILEDTSKYVDLEFYGRCLDIAGTNRVLRVQAYIFYKLTRLWGIFSWPEIESENI